MARWQIIHRAMSCRAITLPYSIVGFASAHAPIPRQLRDLVICPDERGVVNYVQEQSIMERNITDPSSVSLFRTPLSLLLGPLFLFAPSCNGASASKKKLGLANIQVAVPLDCCILPTSPAYAWAHRILVPLALSSLLRLQVQTAASPRSSRHLLPQYPRASPSLPHILSPSPPDILLHLLIFSRDRLKRPWFLSTMSRTPLPPSTSPIPTSASSLQADRTLSYTYPSIPGTLHHATLLIPLPIPREGYGSTMASCPARSTTRSS